MRMLLRVSIPVEAGNAAAKDGKLGSTVEKILADLKPEAACFFADDNGNRSGSIVFDMKDTSEIPAIAEPWFLAFNANVSFRPVMNPQDLAKAGPAITNVCQGLREVGPPEGTALASGNSAVAPSCSRTRKVSTCPGARSQYV
jgi:hypothetical protein